MLHVLRTLRMGSLVIGVGLFVTMVAVFARSPLALGMSVLALLMAWKMREYEPLTILGVWLYLAAASFTGELLFVIANSGGQVDRESMRWLVQGFLPCALLALLALVRIYSADARPRGTVLAWAVLVQGLWWAWFLEGLSWFETSAWRGEVAIGLALLGQLVLALLVIGWLRRMGWPKLAKLATSLSVVIIAGYAVRLSGHLIADEEYFDWGVPSSTTGVAHLSQPKRWQPTVGILGDGSIVITRDILELDQAKDWLRLAQWKMVRDDRLFLEADGELAFGGVSPLLRACLEMRKPITEVNLVVRGAMPARHWRQVLADVYPVRAGESVIPLLLASEAPAGVVTVVVDPNDKAPGVASGYSAALRIGPRVTMQRVVEQLDRLRETGCRELTLLVPLAPDH